MVISNSVSLVSSAPSDVALATASGGDNSRAMSLPRLGKTLGTLALALSAGQAEASTGFNQGRRLLEGHSHVEVSPDPYPYNSLCHDGIIQAHIDGLTKEGCLDQEQEKIDAIRDRKPLGLLKKCYSISGYLSAGLTGVAAIGGVAGAEAIGASAICLAITGLIPTAVCGAVSNTIKARLHDSRKVAEHCCKYFVSQENLATNTTSNANNTTSVDPMLTIPSLTNSTVTNTTIAGATIPQSSVRNSTASNT